MGLRFCNEIVIAAEQIFPSLVEEMVKSKPLTNAQGFTAVPFALDLGISTPPSVRLVPCRPYTGSPIGTTYEVQLFASTAPEDLPKRRKMVQMSLRLYERMPKEIPPRSIVSLDKSYIFSESNLNVQARLDNGVYSEDDTISLTLQFRRPGGHGVKKIKVATIQQVGVAMFSTGNFKNNLGGIVEEVDPMEACYRATLSLKMKLTKDYSWVAMDETTKKDAEIKFLAPTVVHGNKAMFIIRVHYYVHITLCFGILHRAISIKLPFLLKRSEKQLNMGSKSEKKSEEDSKTNGKSDS